MSQLRYFFINGCIWAILLLTFGLLLIRRDCWPLCNYPMFESLTRRVDAQAVEFYTVAQGRETLVDLSYTSMVHWGHVLPDVLHDKGWPSRDTEKFFQLVLANLQRRSLKDDPSAPPPTAIKVYSVTYHYPESGDFQPIVLNKSKLFEVEAAK